MLPIRRWPQTLLLTALSLLIAAATLMLACNPAARPVADGGMAILPAMPPVAGGIEDMPTVEPTALPTAEPTATPTPYPTLCIVMPRDLQHLAEAELKEGQIRRVRRDGLLMQCEAVTPTPPPPTLKYPELGEQLSRYAQEAEAAQSAAAEVEIPLVYLHIVLSSNTEEVVAWLQRNGIPLSEDWVEGERGYIAGYEAERELGDDYIYAWVPASLLVAISQQEGITYMEDAGYLLDYGAGY